MSCGLNLSFKHILVIIAVVTSLSASSQNDSLTWDGLTRYYKVHVPPSYSSSKPSALVLALHGGFGSGSQLETQSQLSPKADQEGFIVAYPDGFRNILGIRTWNADGCCGTAQSKNIDDVGFINNLIDTLENKYNIDAQKIFVTGMSNGAFMSYRLACELSHRIAAIAPVAGTMNVQNCPTTRQVPVIHFHSYLDSSVPYSGGIGNGVSSHYNPPLDSVSNVWKTNNSCSSIDTVQNDNDLLHIKWHNCSCQGDVELFLTHDGGHSWHGGQKNFGGDNVSNVVSANDKMWEFFMNNKLCVVSKEELYKDEISISPNPFKNQIKLSFENNLIEKEYLLYNSLGKVILAGTIRKGKLSHIINTAAVPMGIYFLTVQKQGSLLTMKVVKQ